MARKPSAVVPTYIVYEIRDPRDNCCIYVGKSTIARWHNRQKEHLREANFSELGILPGNMFKARVMQKIVDSGHKPAFTICTTHVTDADASSEEIRLIAEHGRRDRGCGPLTNLTDGGDGAFGWLVSDTVREKLRRQKSPEHAEKVAATKRGIPTRPELVRRGWKHTNETKLVMSVAASIRMKGRPKSASFIAKQREKMLGNTIWSGRRHTDAARQKMSENGIGKNTSKWSDERKQAARDRVKVYAPRSDESRARAGLAISAARTGVPWSPKRVEAQRQKKLRQALEIQS